MPAAVVDIQWQNFHIVALGVVHQLRGRVKTHGLAVEQAAVKGGRVVALDPCREVREQAETGRVGLREAIGTEAFHLLEKLLRQAVLVTVGKHAVDQLFAKL